METVTEKNQKIAELESGLGDVSARLLNLTQKLENKFGKEFSETSSFVDKVLTPAERERSEKEHEEHMKKYFEDQVPRVRDRRPGSAYVLKNLAEPSIDPMEEHPERYVTITSDRYDTYGNRTGIECWRYNDDKGVFVVHRKNGAVEYYASTSAFNSWTKIDLTELSRSPFINQTRNPRNKIGLMFHKRIQEQAKVNFRDMKTASSMLVEYKGVRGADGKPFKTVQWPPTEKLKIIPLSKPMDRGCLKDMRFWVYDPTSSSAVIVCDTDEFRISDARDLMSLHSEDVQVLARHQIQCDPTYELCAKSITSAVAQVDRLGLASDKRGRVDTELFGLYVGKSPEEWKRAME